MRRKIIRRSRYFVYLVRCKNGMLYAGYTSNLKNRVALHNKGRGAKYLRGKGPVKLVYAREYRYYKNALNAERKMKTLPRAKKEKLIRSYKRKRG